MDGLTTEQICDSYKHAKNKRAQIKILAELCACDRETITQVLIDAGLLTGELATCRRCGRTYIRQESTYCDTCLRERSIIEKAIATKKITLRNREKRLRQKLDAIDAAYITRVQTEIEKSREEERRLNEEIEGLRRAMRQKEGEQ